VILGIHLCGALAIEAMESGGTWGFYPHTTWKSDGKLMKIGLTYGKLMKIG
jgi:hypothetical protein